MAEFKFKPVVHNHTVFLEKASKRKGFREAYESRAVDYALASAMLAARTRAGLTQEAVAMRMNTTKSAISRLEAADKHAPSMASLRKYAGAVGCMLKIELVPQRAASRGTTRQEVRRVRRTTARQSS